jgi:hypothetical protein
LLAFKPGRAEPAAMRVRLLLLAVVLAGCAAPPASTPSPASPDQPPPADRIETPAGLPGVVLGASSAAQGQRHWASAWARNEGGRTYWMKADDCGGAPWFDTMRDSRGAVQHQPPMASCSICSWGPFAPGDEVRGRFTWDELVWDLDSTHQDAPPGQYAWELHFRIRTEPGCDGYADAKVELPVAVA